MAIVCLRYLNIHTGTERYCRDQQEEQPLVIHQHGGTIRGPVAAGHRHARLPVCHVLGRSTC